MFWRLLLAHYMGDFLLQTDWMAQNRDKFWVLTLHSSIHFATMVLIIGPARLELWPLILVLALIHMGQDALKIYLTQKQPDLSVLAFIWDQILHYLLIWIFSWIFRMGAGPVTMDQSPAWLMISISYLFISIVWFITERVLYQSHPDYVLKINQTKYPRMLARTGIVSLFLFIRSWMLPSLAVLLPNPYQTTKFRQRFLITDISVSFFVILFLYWSLS